MGHLLGDAVLQQVANVLRATARHMDILARLGGDEFAVLLPGSNLEEASHVAERLRAAMLKRSDSALYAAEEAGRNCSFRDAGPEPAVPVPCN